MSQYSKTFSQVVDDIAIAIRDGCSGITYRIASLENEQPIPEQGPFVDFMIKTGTTVVKEIGDGAVSRRTGLLFARISNNDGEGSSEQLEIADMLSRLFEYKTHGVVNFREASLACVGSNNSRFEYALTVPFYSE